MTGLLIVAAMIALAATWLLARYAPALRLVDMPNERSSHLTPTPRGGGLGVLCGIAAAAALAPAAMLSNWLPFLLASGPIAIIGLIDDRIGLSPALRFSIQVICAAAFCLWYSGPPAGTVSLLMLAASVLAIVWSTNLFNFMDGIDGIAGGEALFIGGSAAWLAWSHDRDLALLLGSIAAASAGFLVWNWAPARIFMGDVGSAFNGFLLAAIAVATIADGAMTVPEWLALGSLFIADSGVTLFRRVLAGERWWSAHRTHAYQHLSRRLGSHARVSGGFLLINIAVALPVTWIAHMQRQFAWPLVVTLLTCCCIAAVCISAGRQHAADTDG